MSLFRWDTVSLEQQERLNIFRTKVLACLQLRKVHEGRPHCVDRIRSGEVSIVINTTTGRRSIEASFDIRRACIDNSIPCITESDAAEAFILALAKISIESHSSVSFAADGGFLRRGYFRF
jgi:carbamoyl-phosphate synthase large subunit